MTLYHRILAIVALDSDDILVLRRAMQLSRWSGAPLLVTYILDHHSGFECDQVPVLTREQIEASLLDAAREKISALLDSLGAEQPRLLMLKGKPLQAAPAVAQEWRADLVVCGSAARYGLDRGRLNASAYRGDVLSVRAERAGFGSRLRAWLQPLLQS